MNVPYSYLFLKVYLKDASQEKEEIEINE